jgi:cystathionine beta-synthase
MQENRFFDFEEISIKRVLENKSADLPTLISMSQTEPLRSALDKMKTYNIGQIPIIENGQSVGSIEESVAMGKVLEDSSLMDKPVKYVMQEAFPVFDSHKNVETLKHCLASKRCPAVLVKEYGEIVGIITKMDLLEFMAA